MPELVSQKTRDFELSIWCNSIEASQAQLIRTMLIRGVEVANSIIYFTPPVTCPDPDESTPSAEVHLCDPIFFENKSYEVEFIFSKHLCGQFGPFFPRVNHPLKSIEESFRYNPKTGSLRATINTGNDIGWFSLEISYLAREEMYTQQIAFEVLPVKMDIGSDVESINKDIDAEYPLWRFALPQTTRHYLHADRRRRQPFLLLWLAQFEKLCVDMEKGLKHIVNAPHSRLLEYSSSVKLEKLKGRLSPGLELQIKESLNAGIAAKRFIVNRKRLSLDTPENQFIKFVINSSIERISKIIKLARAGDHLPTRQRLSESFFNNLSGWRNSLIHIGRNRLFEEVSEFSGMTRESLVLQQKPGYAKVYKTWQQLKWFLDQLGNDSALSVRNVAELYEVWCFLQVRNILIEIGFSEILNKKAVLVNRGLDVAMQDGMAGAFHFYRDDGVYIRLAHEPIFRETTKPVRTWMTTQKPDIVLKADFPDGTEIFWIFDAKYRIDTNLMENSDLVPDDAFNQMHRYRDALIYQHKTAPSYSDKSRPVFGAYVLYPGYFDQATQRNPYQEAIEEIGIGAFSLLPSGDGAGSLWLRNFLNNKLATSELRYSEMGAEKFFVENPVRIPYRGTRVAHYNDLTAIFSGRVPGRSEEYLRRLAAGELVCYHTRLLATERQNIENHIIREIRYLAVAVSEVEINESVKFVYPVKTVQLVKRGILSIEQTGSNLISDPNEDYWYFELGRAINLSTTLSHASPKHFEVLLTSYNALENITNWAALPKRYTILTQ